MEYFWGIRYCFDKNSIHAKLDELVCSSKKGYVCVADGVTLALNSKNPDIRKVLADSAITLCDSGWVPIYLKLIYHIKRQQYSGSELLEYLVLNTSYRMMFLGSTQETLDHLKQNLSLKNEKISSMTFDMLPVKKVTEFNYEEIAGKISEDNPDIIFVSLGLPKQEFFMYNLAPFLNRGVLIGVGAAFKFHSGLMNQKRAPGWMIKAKMEWVYRIFKEPQKQLKRCSLIFYTMPGLFIKELIKSKKSTP